MIPVNEQRIIEGPPKQFRERQFLSPFHVRVILFPQRRLENGLIRHRRISDLPTHVAVGIRPRSRTA